MFNFYDIFSKPEALLFYDTMGLAFEYEFEGEWTEHHERMLTPVMHIIKKRPEYVYAFAQHAIKGRWIEAEPAVMIDTQYACLYARDIIRGPWPEAEQYIIQNARWACVYATLVLKRRWLEAEEIIKTNTMEWGVYCSELDVEDDLA